MTRLKQLIQERKAKRDKLEEFGMDPYPGSVDRSHSIGDLKENFSELKSAGDTITTAGRVIGKRVHGSVIFADVQSQKTQIQIVLKEAALSEDDLFDLFAEAVDVGDFVSVTGVCDETKTGQNSIMVSDWRIVAKALRPIPQQYSGLENKEKRLRKRHLDMLMNSQVYELARKRSDFWSAIRSFLEDRDFLEVQTPILEKTPGGADARPFSSYHNALDMDVFLRISAGELWQKRLLVAGFEKTFEIGRVFRNEGISPEHAQDFMQMEFYWAYADIADGMSLVKKMYRHIAYEVFGTKQFTIGDHEVDLSDDWEQIDYKDTIDQKTGIHIDEAEIADIVDYLESHGVSPKKSDSRVRLIDKVWKTVRSDVTGPGFLVNVPKALSPLAKENKENSNVVDQFQPIIAGSELGKGYSELNNPTEQAKRFVGQEELRAAGDKEAQRNDANFVEALEYGMPPACGFGIGERLLAFLLDMPIREVQLFPLVRDKT